MQRLERERRVPHPGVSVVPVALAAWRLGQRRRGRGHGCACRHVRQPLDRQSRALDRVAEGVVGDTRASQPTAPEARGGGHHRIGLVGVVRHGQTLGPRERAEGALARPQDVPGPRAVALDSELEARSEPDRAPVAARVCGMVVAVDERPLRRRRARSRRPARRSARARPRPRGTRRSARACARRRRPPEAACAA